MVHKSSKGHRAEAEEEEEELPTDSTANGFSSSDSGKVAASLHISTSRKGLLNDDDILSTEKPDFLRVIPHKLNVLRLSSSSNSASPSARFRQIAEERDEISRSVPSTGRSTLQERFNGILAQKVDWASLWATSKTWIKDPLNMALFLWITCVVVSGAILFLVMTGMLNGVLHNKSLRDAWFEVNNQILNALFTLMCLYQHPKRFHHLVLLCRWRPKDIITLRKIYCKNGTYKPNEWAHMMVVVVLLHVNCFAQYALCSLNLGYKRSKRPAVGVGICLSVAIAAPAIAGVYCIVSPLGRDYEYECDEEAQDNHILTNHVGYPGRQLSLEKRFSFASRNEQRVVEYSPDWRGGLFDIWDSITLAYLSLFCSFCVFGWNMERLGFGNMYVHTATFLLFCTAPFWIFNLAAINIENETVRESLGLTGIVLCLFGLLYGGFWRIQMRERFNLPANNACFGKPDILDCAQWICCCWCSLAQEVRTADFYDIVEDKFCRKQTDNRNEFIISPLPREDGDTTFRSNPKSPTCHSPRISKLGNNHFLGTSRFLRKSLSPSKQPSDFKEVFTKNSDGFMEPPTFSRIQREGLTELDL